MEETLALGFDGGTQVRFRVLRGWAAKMRGLLGSTSRASPVVLVGCGSIHTFGMHYAIDVALVDREGRVRKVRRALPPGRIMGAPRAWLAFERPASQDPWMREGGTLAPYSRAIGGHRQWGRC